jgi:hypothetical protein
MFKVPEDDSKNPTFDNFVLLEKTCPPINNTSSEKNVVMLETSWFLLIELAKIPIDTKNIPTIAMNNDAPKIL